MNNDQDNFLGGGSYGKVVDIGGKAIKQFDHTPFLIQEFASGRFLRDAKNIIHFDSLNLKNKTIGMPLYNISLDKFIDEFDKTCWKVRMDIFRDITIGLSVIHSKGLLHGDIKPGNVLLKFNTSKHCFCSNCASKCDNPISAFICDLGFTSLKDYAKTEYTTLVYADDSKSEYKSINRDLYSLGILALELFGAINIHNRLNQYDINQIINDEISSRTIGNMIRSLTNPVESARMTTTDILQDIYQLSFRDIFGNTNSSIGNKNIITNVKNRSKIEEWMKYTAIKYNIKCVNKGIDLACHYFNKYNIDKGKYHLYSAVIL